MHSVRVAEEAVFSSEHWSTLVGVVKNRRAASELLDSANIALEMKKVEESLLEERKAKKKLLKQSGVEEKDQEEEGGEDQEEVPEEEVKMKHMCIKDGDAPTLPVEKSKSEKAW